MGRVKKYQGNTERLWIVKIVLTLCVYASTL